MAKQTPKTDDLVMTQAELPPGTEGVSAPSVQDEIARQARADDGASTAELLREIRQLADRVGGIDRLRELIDELAKMSR
jgi:hypothetical protein